MGWENLQADLDDLFGEFTTHADGMLSALEDKIEKRRAYFREYDRSPYRRAYKREKAKSYVPSLEAQERKRERARARWRLFKGEGGKPRDPLLLEKASALILGQGLSKAKAAKVLGVSKSMLKRYTRHLPHGRPGRPKTKKMEEAA